MNCPYLDQGNPHCSKYLNIAQINEAFDYCTSHYQVCPIYLQICYGQANGSKAGARKAALPKAKAG